MSTFWLIGDRADPARGAADLGKPEVQSFFVLRIDY
jgi:hypothetical protein